MSEILQHHGVKGQKWGVRKDKYGNKKKGSILFAPHRAMMRPMIKAHKSNLDAYDKQDQAAIRYETKNMSDKQKRLYELNYYNDRKVASTLVGRNAQTTLDSLKKPNKSRSEQRSIDALGSDFITLVGETQLSAANDLYKHYENKVNSLIQNMGDIELSTIRSTRYVNNGNDTISWEGVEYVSKN